MLQKGGQKGVIFRIPRARARARARGDKSGFVLEIIATPLEIEFPKNPDFDPFLDHFLGHSGVRLYGLLKKRGSRNGSF